MSLGLWFLTFWTNILPSYSGSRSPRRLKYCASRPLTLWALQSFKTTHQWQIVASQKTWILMLHFLFNQEVKLTCSTFIAAVRSTSCNLANCILHVWSICFPNWRICSTLRVLLPVCTDIPVCGGTGEGCVRCQPSYWRLGMKIWFTAGRPTKTTITTMSARTTMQLLISTDCVPAICPETVEEGNVVVSYCWQ